MNEHDTVQKHAGDTDVKGSSVDLIGVARAAQRSDEVSWKIGSVKLIAPAKVNLFLGIGSRHGDGYHEVKSVLHAVNLHDVLYMRLLPGEEGATGLSVRVSMSGCEGLEPPKLASEDNIVHRAIVELAVRVGRTRHETVEVHIEKHIPFEAGLGGGSSDAAAALLGAAHLWGMDPHGPQIEDMAQALGSDVAFFLYGGCAYFDGMGENFVHALEPMKDALVLIKPDEGISTARAYASFDERPNPIDAEHERAAAAETKAQDVPLFNNLAPASELLLPVLFDVREWSRQQPGVRGALLCGSGSTTFVVCESFDDACRLAAAARRRGWWARTTTFGSAKAALVPSVSG